MTETALTREIARAVERIRPILAGRPPGMQGAILADLLAIWLAGHVAYDANDAHDADATRKLRTSLLARHCTAVRRLVPGNAKILDAPP